MNKIYNILYCCCFLFGFERCPDCIDCLDFSCEKRNDFHCCRLVTDASIEALICHSARVGDITALRQLAKEGCLFRFIDASFNQNPFVCAAAHGQVEVLRFLFKEALLFSPWVLEQEVLNTAFITAAANGQLEALKFLFKEVTRFCVLFPDQEILEQSFFFAASGGHVDVLHFLCKESFFRCPFIIEERNKIDRAIEHRIPHNPLLCGCPP